MLRDARTVANDEVVESDVCIIGAGPAGITIARQLEHSGLQVALLESGGTEHDPSTLELTKGETTGYPYDPLHEVRAAGFGGSSSLWQEEDALRARPLDPIDFESRAGLPDSGWPFGVDHLEPFYRQAEELCLLSPLSYDVDDWEDPPTMPRVGLRRGRFHTKIFKFTGDVEVFRRHLADIADSASVTLFTHGHAVRLDPSKEGGAIESVEVVGLWSTAFTLKAKVFVLAAGGIENPRLLLLSGEGSPSGVGNQYDLVGRYFMEHPRVSSGILVPHDPAMVNRLGLYRRHLIDGWKVVGVLAPSSTTIRSEEILNGVVYLRESNQLRSTDTFRSLAVIRDRLAGKESARAQNFNHHLRQVIGHPWEAWRAFRGREAGGGTRSVIEFVFQTEQAPNRGSRVSLGASKDPLGFPRARVEWRLSDIDIYTIRRIQEILAEELEASGLGRVERFLGEEIPPAVLKGHRHLMGTTRMHLSPRKGVVDENCLVHGVSNLYVAGSSVFPTVGYANPTLTIVAMSIRLAGYLAKRLQAPVDIRVEG